MDAERRRIQIPRRGVRGARVVLRYKCEGKSSGSPSYSICLSRAPAYQEEVGKYRYGNLRGLWGRGCGAWGSECGDPCNPACSLACCAGFCHRLYTSETALVLLPFQSPEYMWRLPTPLKRCNRPHRGRQPLVAIVDHAVVDLEPYGAAIVRVCSRRRWRTRPRRSRSRNCSRLRG